MSQTFTYQIPRDVHTFLRHRRRGGDKCTLISNLSHDFTLRKWLPAGADYALVCDGQVVWHGVHDRLSGELTSAMPLPSKGVAGVRKPTVPKESYQIRMSPANFEEFLAPAIQRYANARGCSITVTGRKFEPEPDKGAPEECNCEQSLALEVELRALQSKWDLTVDGSKPGVFGLSQRQRGVCINPEGITAADIPGS